MFAPSTITLEKKSPATEPAGQETHHRILVVEDEAIIAADIQRRLQRLGYQVPLCVATGEEAIRQAAESLPDLVLMDIRLDGTIDGIEAASKIRRQLSLPIIFLTAHSDPGTLHRARETAPFGYLTKPFQDRELYACIELAIYRHKADLELRRREQWLGAVLRGIADGVVATDPSGRVIFVNPVAEKLLGWRQDEIVGRVFSEIFNVVGELSRRPVSNPIEKALIEGRSTNFVGDVILVSKNGTQTPITDTAAPIWDHEGKIIGAVLVFRDNTQAKRAAAQISQMNSQLEKRVQERTAELENANKEMAAFSYSVSHDLRAPLRHLDGYTELLRQECGGQLSDQGRRYLDVIANSSRRMGKLIDGLLAFCRIGRMEMALARVNMRDLVAEVMAELEVGPRKETVKWEVAALPDAMGDRLLLKQVWGCLMANALKYTRKRNPALIKIGSVARGNLTEYFVNDNGAGFDMRFAGKLFGVFERLHHEDEFEGTGIGLANVRRIIVRHGGSVRAEGQVGAGATFYFTLPLAPATTAEGGTAEGGTANAGTGT